MVRRLSFSTASLLTHLKCPSQRCFGTIPQSMFADAKASGPSVSWPIGDEPLTMDLPAPPSKEARLRTAMVRHCARTENAYSGGNTPVRARQRYAQYFLEKDLRVGDTCLLCGFNVGDSWYIHSSFSMHRISTHIFGHIFENHRFRSAKALKEKWMHAALVHENVSTIKPLLSYDIDVLRKRLHQLINILGRHGKLKSCLSFIRGRSFDFDRAEWIGDVALPPLILAAAERIFPLHTEDSLWRHIHVEIGVLFGNPHLETTFDFLELHKLIEGSNKLVRAKTKSDFVETLAGELEICIRESELEHLTTRDAYPVSLIDFSLRQLATHTLHVLATLVLMAFLYPAIDRIVDVIARINAAEGCNLDRVPRDVRIAHMIPMLLPARHFLKAGPHRIESGGRAECFSLKSMREPFRTTEPVLHRIRLDVGTAAEPAGFEEPTATLPALIEDTRLYED